MLTVELPCHAEELDPAFITGFPLLHMDFLIALSKSPNILLLGIESLGLWAGDLLTLIFLQTSHPNPFPQVSRSEI